MNVSCVCVWVGYYCFFSSLVVSLVFPFTFPKDFCNSDSDSNRSRYHHESTLYAHTHSHMATYVKKSENVERHIRYISEVKWNADSLYKRPHMVSLYVKIEWNNARRIVRVLQCRNSRIHRMERWRERERERVWAKKREIASKNVNVSDRPIDLPTDQSTKIWNRAARMKDFVAILLWLLPIWKSKTAIVHSDTRRFDQSALIVYRITNPLSFIPLPLPPIYLFHSSIYLFLSNSI